MGKGQEDDGTSRGHGQVRLDSFFASRFLTLMCSHHTYTYQYPAFLAPLLIAIYEKASVGKDGGDVTL